MELNREQIIKALGFCGVGVELRNCTCDCPYFSIPLEDIENCCDVLARDALSLIRELTEERDGLKQHNNYLKGLIDHAFVKELRSFDENSAARATAEAEMWRMIALREKLLIEENDRLKAENAEQDEAIIKALQRMGEVRRETQADTVRKYRECLHRLLASLGAKDKFNKEFFLTTADKIAEELLEGNQ